MIRNLVEIFDIDATASRNVKAALDRGGPVYLVFNSCGGAHDPAFAIADAIRAHGSTVTGRVHERCDSAAVLCYAACHVRGAAIGARFTMHESAGDPADLRGRLTATALRREADRQAALDRRYRSLIAEFTGADPAELAEVERAERVLTAREAADLGLVTALYGHSALMESIRQRRARRAASKARPAPTPALPPIRATFAPIAAPFVGLRIAANTPLSAEGGVRTGPVTAQPGPVRPF